MSYQVYVTRAGFWAENEGSEIPAREWLELLQQDEELTQDPSNGPYFAVLGGSRENDESWLDWTEGNIYTAYPDRRTQEKMLQIAGQVGGVVQGDDGEPYASLADFPETIRRDRAVALAKERLPAYKRREILWGIITFAAIAAAIIVINVFDLW